MRYLALILSVFFVSTLAAEDNYSPEELFVAGTAFLNPDSSSYNPEKGLEYLLNSANYHYEHAPFGLCSALSLDRTILDLESAYAWCYVAEKIPNEYSSLAGKRGGDILVYLEEKMGVVAVKRAKQLAVEKYGK